MELWRGRAGQAEGKDEGGEEKHKTKKTEQIWFKNSSSRMRSCTLGVVIRHFNRHG